MSLILYRLLLLIFFIRVGDSSLFSNPSTDRPDRRSKAPYQDQIILLRIKIPACAGMTVRDIIYFSMYPALELIPH